MLFGNRDPAQSRFGPLVEEGADFLAVSGAVWNGDEVATIEAFTKQLG